MSSFYKLIFRNIKTKRLKTELELEKKIQNEFVLIVIVVSKYET